MSNKTTSNQTDQLLVEPATKQTINAEEVELKSTEQATKPKEINGPKGLEPTRYGDWESKGRCYDF